MAFSWFRGFYDQRLFLRLKLRIFQSHGVNFLWSITGAFWPCWWLFDICGTFIFVVAFSDFVTLFKIMIFLGAFQDCEALLIITIGGAFWRSQSHFLFFSEFFFVFFSSAFVIKVIFWRSRRTFQYPDSIFKRLWFFWSRLTFW